MSKLSKSSATLLTWLHSAYVADKRPVVWQELQLLFPGMTASGHRSLVFQLHKRKLLTVDQIDSDKLLTITSHGMNEITARFPALSSQMSSWQGEWSVLVFLNSISADPQFRFLRQFLLEHHCGQLSRGVYLFPGQLPAQIAQQLSFYPAAVTVLTVNSWQFGDERSVIGSIFSLTDLCNTLSGVSREISSLLPLRNYKKGLTFQNSSPFSVVIDRLLSILEFDLGIHKKYFPQVPSVNELLANLQALA